MDRISMMKMTPLIRNYIREIKFKIIWIESKRSTLTQHSSWETSAIKNNIDYFDHSSLIFSLLVKRICHVAIY